MLDTATMITIGLAVGLPALAAARAWGKIEIRIRELEVKAVAHDALRVALDGCASTIETVRNKQGDRLGKLEASTESLAGRFEGFQTGFGAGRRSRTAAHVAGGGVAKGGAGE